MDILARITRYFRPYVKWVVLSTFLNVFVSFTDGAMAIFIKPVFDEVFFGKNLAFLKWIPIVLLSLVVIKGVLGYLHGYIMTDVCVRVVVRLRADMYQHYLKLSMTQFDNTPVGQMMSRVTADVAGLQQAIPTLVNLLRQIITLLVLVAVALYRDWQLTLVGLSVVPFTAVPIYFISNALKRNQRKILGSMGDLNTIAYEAFSGIRVIKVFGTEKKEVDKFKKEQKKFFTIALKNMLIGLSANPLTEIITTIGISVIFVLGGLHAIKGEITPGEFFSFVAAVMLMYRPIRRIADINKILQQLMASGERVFQVMDELPDVVDKPGAVEIEPIKKKVHYHNVRFRYPQASKRIMGQDGIETIELGVEQDWVVRDLDFSIGKGETVALVGSSGAGKTTVASLLPRFYDVTEGSIEIDGTDIRDATLESLRKQMALVTQETYLFNEPVWMNIAYGLEREVTREEIEKAAKAANAHEFIMELPEGYDSVIGERGVLISGGQRQRLAIARALLRNAPILILDEATSSLDTESEREVQNALEVLMHDRTTLVIAHRLSTIRKATRIVVLEEGRKVEEGTHEELIAKGGTYKYLYELQYFGDARGQAACG